MGSTVGPIITIQRVGTYRRGPQARESVDLNCSHLRLEPELFGYCSCGEPVNRDGEREVPHPPLHRQDPR